MGRKSKAQLIIEQLKDEPEDQGDFLVFYDFHGGNPSRFYKNLDRILARLGGWLVQLSVVRTQSKRAALATKYLAEGYRADVEVYKIKRQIE